MAILILRLLLLGNPVILTVLGPVPVETVVPLVALTIIGVASPSYAVLAVPDSLNDHIELPVPLPLTFNV